MVTINLSFVFEVLALHGHIARCDYFGKYLDCKWFYNWGLKWAGVIITLGFCRLTGLENRWEFASPQLACKWGLSGPGSTSRTTFLFPLRPLSMHAPTGIATNSSPYIGSVTYCLLLVSLVFSEIVVYGRNTWVSLLPVLLYWQA